MAISVNGSPAAPIPDLSNTPGMVVAEKINSGEVPLAHGLKRMGELLSAAKNEDDRVDDLTAVTAPPGAVTETETASIQNLAEALARIKRGELVANLAVVLGLAAFSETAPEISDVDELFGVLLMHERKRHEAVLAGQTYEGYSFTAQQDAFLARFLLIFNQRLLDEKNFKYFGPNASDYFEARIRDQLEEKLRAYSGVSPDSLGKEFEAIPAGIQREARGLLTRYACLADLIGALEWPEWDEWLFRNMALLTHVADFRSADLIQEENDPELKPATVGARRVMNRILTIWRRSGGANLALSLRQIGNAIDNANALIKNGKKLVESRPAEFFGFYQALQQIIDEVSGLFDHSLEQYRFETVRDCRPGESGCLMARWRYLIDARLLKVLRPFRALLIEAASSSALKGKLNGRTRFPEHPLTRVYFERALQTLKWEGSIEGLKPKLVPLSERFSAYQESLSNFKAGVETFSGRRAVSENKEFQRMADYVAGYHQIEGGRRFLEAQAGLQIQALGPFAGAMADPQDQSVAVYADLLKNLSHTLAIGFKERLDASGAGEEDPKVLKLEDLKLELIEQRTDGTIVYAYKEKEMHLDLQPGIYETDINVRLQAKSMSFHPLSMLRAAGKTVTLEVVEGGISDAWVDVSSPDAFGNKVVHHIRPGEGERNKRQRRVCRLVERDGDDDYADIVVFDENYTTGESGGKRAGDCFDQGDGNEQDRCLKLLGYSRDYRSDEWRHCELFVQKGRPAPAPDQTPAGRPAGAIQFSGAESLALGEPLLVALGGNGAPGVQGADSPLCVNGVYEIPTEENPYVLFNHVGKSETEAYDFVRKNVWSRGIPYSYRKDYDLSSGPGGRGGDASTGGSVEFPNATGMTSAVVLIAPGVPGTGGETGTCGSSTDNRSDLRGSNGAAANPGKLGSGV